MKRTIKAIVGTIVLGIIVASLSVLPVSANPNKREPVPQAIQTHSGIGWEWRVISDNAYSYNWASRGNYGRYEDMVHSVNVTVWLSLDGSSTAFLDGIDNILAYDGDEYLHIVHASLLSATQLMTMTNDGGRNTFIVVVNMAMVSWDIYDSLQEHITDYDHTPSQDGLNAAYSVKIR